VWTEKVHTRDRDAIRDVINSCLSDNDLVTRQSEHGTAVQQDTEQNSAANPENPSHDSTPSDGLTNQMQGRDQRRLRFM
jgi:hypothetical protein